MPDGAWPVSAVNSKYATRERHGHHPHHFGEAAGMNGGSEAYRGQYAAVFNMGADFCCYGGCPIP